MLNLSYNSDNMEETLKSLGLGEYEARIYAILSEHSPASASYIAKKAGLSRSSVYTALSSLSAKSLVGTSYKNEVKQFVAEGFDALGQMLQTEKRELDRKQRDLASMERIFKSDAASLFGVPRIVFFEGKESLKKIYKSMLWNAPKGSTMYILRNEFVWDEDWRFIFDQEWHSAVKKIRVEKNIRTKLIINGSAL